MKVRKGYLENKLADARQNYERFVEEKERKQREEMECVENEKGNQSFNPIIHKFKTVLTIGTL